MKLTDLNRAQDIGSNCFHIQLGPFSILVDSGIHPKKYGISCTPDFSKIPPYSLDLIILTHCHLDHLGALPIIARENPQASILLSSPSSMLASRMLINSYHVMLRQREELNLAEYPLYTRRDIQLTESAFLTMAFDRPRHFYKDNTELEVIFHRAGHIAGASSVSLIYKHRHILFSGDVLFEKQLTIPKAHIDKRKVDILILETTRGATKTPSDYSRQKEIDHFISTVNSVILHGGSCLIPAFALGRMQEIFAILHRAKEQKRLVKCPLFSSGLGMDLVDYFDEISRKTNLVHFSRSIIKDLNIKTISKGGRGAVEKRFSVPGIYVLSSGMVVENTLSYLAAAHFIENPHNAICFVGYCDPETPGGIILRTAPRSPIVFKALEKVAILNAPIYKFDLSGHANREELVDFALECDPRVIVLTHGDPEARDWFFDAFIDCAPEKNIINPETGIRYSI